MRKDGTLAICVPDGKTQVTIGYIDGVPQRVDTIVISILHSEEVSLADAREDLRTTSLCPSCRKSGWIAQTKIYINPTGCAFVQAGR